MGSELFLNVSERSEVLFDVLECFKAVLRCSFWF